MAATAGWADEVDISSIGDKKTPSDAGVPLASAAADAADDFSGGARVWRHLNLKRGL